MEPAGSLSWNLAELAHALKIREADVREYFTDGRRVSFILERRLAAELFGGARPLSEGADYDLVDRNGLRWEVRSLSKGGVYFSPSYMVGSGRVFDSEGFRSKLAQIAGYVLADIEGFPDVRFWVVPVRQVVSWWEAGQLGASTKVSRAKALALLEASVA